MLNIACEPNYNFTIDGHNMTIIEADGQTTEPLTVDFVQIFAAQRYSFIVRRPFPAPPPSFSLGITMTMTTMLMGGDRISLMRLRPWTIIGSGRTPVSRMPAAKVSRGRLTLLSFATSARRSRTLPPRKPQA